MQEIIDRLTATVARQNEELKVYKEILEYKNRKIKRLEADVEDYKEDAARAEKIFTGGYR